MAIPSTATSRLTTFALGSLDFQLPAELEAHEPPEARGLARDEVHLMVSHRADDAVEHHIFRDLPDVLRPGDVLVANDSATIPAAVRATKSLPQAPAAALRVRSERHADRHTEAFSEAKTVIATSQIPADEMEFNLHFSTRLPGGLWVVEPRRVHVSAGERLELAGGESVQLLAPYPDSQRLWIAQPSMDVHAYLREWGHPISYDYVPEQWPLDMYQTVYAGPPGSAEMPSAGRGFTPDILERLAHKGVEFRTLTLHTGVASLEGHERPYAEEYWVPRCTAQAVEKARADGRRVIAVGTTVVRALESAADEGEGEVIASHAWTELVVTPERGVRVVNSLLTGLHEPKASHLAMLQAIAGRRHLEVAYGAALEQRYLWHEFGDLHLILA